MKLLFVCLAHSQRSPTAEDLVNKSKKNSAKSCGLDAFSDIPVSIKLLRWADKVFVMESYMKQQLEERFPYERISRKVSVLDIPDTFERNDPQLIRILAEKLKEYL